MDAGPDQTVDEAQLVQFAGSFTNPGGQLAGELIQWDFGDGSIITGTLTPTHSYGDNGIFIVTLTVTNNLGGVSSDWLVASVNNIDPMLTAISNQAVVAGTPLTVTVAFNDPGWLDTHTIDINWGDGITDTFTLPAGVLTLDLVHTFSITGTLTASVSVRDDDNGFNELAFDINVSPAGYWMLLPLIHK